MNHAASSETEAYYIFGGEKESIFLFNINVPETTRIYDHYYEKNNYMTFGPSEEEDTFYPSFTVKKWFLSIFLKGINWALFYKK